MKKSTANISLLLLFLAAPLLVQAQMFSVDEDDRPRSNPFAPYIRLGFQPTTFDFTGNPSSLESGESLAFSGNIAQVGFETGGFNLGVSLGNSTTGLDNRKYFDLNLKFANALYFIRQPKFGIGVPLQLGTKLTSVRSDDINTEFSQTNLHAGAGATGFLFFPEKMSVTLHFIPSVGFSTASGGLIGGNVFSMRGKARVNFFNLIFGRNISLGYDYIYDSYDIDGEEFDYDLNGHSITLGVSL